MKELSIEEKAKRYDEAIKVAKDIRNGKATYIPDGTPVIEALFLELKESEDERIKDCIGICLTDADEQRFKDFNTTLKDCLDWLHNQGENAYNEELSKLLHKVICHFINNPDIPYSKRDEVSKKVIPYVEKLEKQNEQNLVKANEEWYDFIRWFVKERTDNYTLIPSDDDIHKWGDMILNHAQKIFEKQGKKKSINDLTQQEAMDIAVAKCFEQGEHELADVEEPDFFDDFRKTDFEVEPKFKVGDWIISHYNNVAYIESISETKYNLRCKDGYHEKLDIDCINRNWRLWTIQDAKAGDVLIDNYNNVVIYQEPCSNLLYHSFCFASAKVFVDSGGSHFIEGTYPATKEQRDLLFQKMKEAGYEWDAEKKELIEQEPADLPKGEDYGIDGLYHAIRILKDTLGKVDGYQTDDGILEHKCAINAVKELYEQKPAWSEEDERRLNSTIEHLEEYEGDTPSPLRPYIWEDIKWLKSLKGRYTWKPSDEQMSALNDVISSRDIKYDVLSKLWEDLQKLKG